MAGCIRTVEPEARKCEIGPAATDIKLTVGGVVVHVALPGMTLAPDVFVWSEVLTFGEIGRARVLRSGLDRSLATVTRCDVPV